MINSEQRYADREPPETDEQRKARQLLEMRRLEREKIKQNEAKMEKA